MKPFAWSFSQLNNYRTCPKRWYHYNVAKDVKEPESESMRWGFAVHAALAAAISRGKLLPDSMPYQNWVIWAVRNVDERTTVETEQQMAITEQFTPCEYFDRVKPVWFRTVLDVVKLRVEDGIARVIDWKTGQMPSNPMKEREAWQQLWLSATAIFAHYPEIKLVRTHLVYLQAGHTPETLQYKDIERKDLPGLWQEIAPTLQGMKDALARQEYLPNPSGLCKKHCHVTSCPHYGVGRL